MLSPGSGCFQYNIFLLFIYLFIFFNKPVRGGVWGLVEKFGLSAAVLQLVLSGLFLEILEGWTAVSFKFSNGKALGTKLVATYDAPVHEDLSVTYVVFHTLYTTLLLSVFTNPPPFPENRPLYSCGLNTLDFN